MTFIVGGANLTYAIALFSKLMLKNYRKTNNDISWLDQIEHDPYLELRKIAFSATPEQLELQCANGSLKLYGIITDIARGPELSTVVTYLNGHASIYFGSGEGLI